MILKIENRHVQIFRVIGTTIGFLRHIAISLDLHDTPWLHHVYSQEFSKRPAMGIHYITMSLANHIFLTFIASGRTDVLCAGGRRFFQVSLTPYGCYRDNWVFRQFKHIYSILVLSIETLGTGKDPTISIRCLLSLAHQPKVNFDETLIVFTGSTLSYFLLDD